MSKINKVIAIFAMIMGLMLMQTTSVYAQENISTQTVTKIGSETSKMNTTAPEEHKASNGYLEVDKEGNVVANPADGYMQKVTVEEVNNKVSKKMREVITVVQNFGIPACIVMFILSLLYTVFGALAKKGALMKGVIAMLVCVVCYTCIAYAYDIVNFASSWLMN